MVIMSDLTVHLHKPHPEQARIKESKAKRKVVRAGRRAGKTTIAAIIAVEAFLKEHRILYGTPTSEQLDSFWYEVKQALAEPIDARIFVKNETEHTVEKPGTKQRIRGKTCWNADTLRGDYADVLILDEFQLMNEDAWGVVGAPMLLDNDGDAIFIYTPPSLHSAGVSKAKDPRHAAKLYKMAQKDTTGRWQAFHFKSLDNPHLSQTALAEITKDMSQAAYKQEILAEDSDESWKGLIYKGFNQVTQVVKRFPIPTNWLIYVGHDFGGANPAAVFFAQDPATAFFYGFREYLPGAGRSTAQNVEEFKQITAGYTVIKRAGGSHQEDEIRQGYGAHGWPILEPSMLNVKAGIDRVCGLFELNKVFVFEDLYQWLFEVSNYSWKLDEQGQVTGDIEDKSKYHLLDSTRGILSGFTPETVEVSGVTEFAVVQDCKPSHIGLTARYLDSILPTNYRNRR